MILWFSSYVPSYISSFLTKFCSHHYLSIFIFSKSPVFPPTFKSSFSYPSLRFSFISIYHIYTSFCAVVFVNFYLVWNITSIDIFQMDENSKFLIHFKMFLECFRWQTKKTNNEEDLNWQHKMPPTTKQMKMWWKRTKSIRKSSRYVKVTIWKSLDMLATVIASWKTSLTVAI